MPNWSLTEWLGVLGFSMGVFNFVFTFRKHFRDEGRANRKERLEAKMRMTELFLLNKFSEIAYDSIAMMIREAEITMFDVSEAYWTALLKAGKTESEAIEMFEAFQPIARAIFEAQTSIRMGRSRHLRSPSQIFKYWRLKREITRIKKHIRK